MAFRFDIDKIVAYLTVSIGDCFYKEEKIMIDEYDFYYKNDKVFLTFAYLDYLVRYSDDEDDDKYNEEEVKIIDDCEEIITTFLQENHLLSKNLNVSDIYGLRIYIDGDKLSFPHKKTNKFDLAKKVIDAFKKDEIKDLTSVV